MAVEFIYRYADTDALARPRPSDSASARLRLDEGNRAFAVQMKGHAGDGGDSRHIISLDPSSFGSREGQPGVTEQHPFAAVLGCSDARVPIELIFNEGPNDLFVVRVAGNGLGGDVLGSLGYAYDHLQASLRLVVVLGHSGCGAMSSAVDAFLEPAGYLPLLANHAVRGILDRLFIVVQATSRRLANVFGADVIRRKGYREALIEASIATNAALAAHSVQKELRRLDLDHLRAVYGVYLLQTQEVWTPLVTPDKTTGLAEPPKDPASFVEFGELVATSDRITTLIAPE